MSVQSLKAFIHLPANEEYESHSEENLVAGGENYGSILLSLNVQIKQKGQKQSLLKELHLVGKLCPRSDFIKKLFNIPVTFKKELEFYRSILPAIHHYLDSNGIYNYYNFFPQYYGSRVSLNNNHDEVDNDACLLLDNLKLQGYRVADRMQGFDFNTAKYLVANLARFHAVPIAVKMNQPELFNKEIKPYLKHHILPEVYTKENNQILIDSITDVVKENAECAKYLDRICKCLEQCLDNMVNDTLTITEPFATITHNDYWVNNTMLKYDTDGNVTSNIMVDFQLIFYGNPAHDLLFFIYSSVDNTTVKQHYQFLIDYYYKTFKNILEELKVDTTPFSYNLFLDEISRAANELQFYHILIMLNPIFKEKGKVGDLTDMDPKKIVSADNLNEKYYEKFYSTILDFVDRKWI